MDLIASGCSHRQIATAMRVSRAAVRREVDKALAERPLHAPERHASLQVARLSRALCHADFPPSPSPGVAQTTFALSRLTRNSSPRSTAIMASTGSSRLSLSPTPPSPSSRRSRRKLHNLAPNTLKSLARLSTLQVRPDAMETRLSPSLTPSLPCHRDRQKLHVSAPKTLKSLGRLSTLHGSSDETGPASPVTRAAEACRLALPSKVARLGAQDVEIARAAIDIGWSVG